VAIALRHHALLTWAEIGKLAASLPRWIAVGKKPDEASVSCQAVL